MTIEEINSDRDKFLDNISKNVDKKIKNKVLEESSMQCKGECKGELQFALTHTFALTEKIIQLDFKIWQRNYYEHIIRDEASHKRISDYILNNPAQWTDDKFYQT